jgi:hypothetical protein
MKVFWNDLKLKFKEQLRVVGKYDLNKPNDYLVKRRKFVDIDISKDFEKRLMEKSKADQIKNIENKQLKLENMNLDQLEAHREKIIKDEEDEKNSDLYKKVILRDVEKMCILANIKTHEFFDKFFEDTQLHPEMRKNLEKIEHSVKYNLPVEKEVNIK